MADACSKCNKPVAQIAKLFQCEKCRSYYCPSCMDRFCLFCKGAVKQAASR